MKKVLYISVLKKSLARHLPEKRRFYIFFSLAEKLKKYCSVRRHCPLSGVSPGLRILSGVSPSGVSPDGGGGEQGKRGSRRARREKGRGQRSDGERESKGQEITGQVSHQASYRSDKTISINRQLSSGNEPLL